MAEKKRKEFIIRKNLKTNKHEEVPVPNGTLQVFGARMVSLRSTDRQGLAYAGYEKLYDLKDKVYNVRNLSNVMSGEDLITFRPPHTQDLKITLANAHESDPYMKRQTGFYTKYVFGDEIKPMIAPLQVETPKSRGENDDLVDKIITSKERKGFMKFVGQVNYISNIHSHMQKIWNQSYVFGMAAGWKTLSLVEMMNVKRDTRIPIGTPVKIKPLDGFYLTNIHQDVDTFDPKFFEYVNPNVTLDEVRNAKDEPITEISLRANTKLRGQAVFLPYDRLIIVKRQNIGATPNTSVYGISPILPILYISENIRRIDEKIFPEINEGMYAGVGIFSVPEDSKYDIEQLALDLSTAGTRIVLNEEIKYIPIPVDFKMDHMINQKLHMIKSEIMALGMPESMFFPTDTNRSTLEILINIWQNVDLKEERKLLQEIMWDQWYKDLMKIYFPKEELIDLELTVKLEFKNKSFAGFIDKAAPTIEAFNVGLLAKPEARENIDQDAFSDYEDDEAFAIILEKEKAKIVGEEQRKTQKEAPKPVAPFGGGAVKKPATAKAKTPTTSTATPKKTTKTSQSTSRSRGGTS